MGAAKAVELKGDERIPVVLIGDGAMSAGEAYEALNELGDRKYPCVIILNDNEMSIAKPVGALSKYISHAMAGPWYQSFKARINELLKYAPDSAAYMAKRLEEGIRLITPGMLFEELGLEYIGPINGHNISEIISTLRTAKAKKLPVIMVTAKTTEMDMIKGLDDGADDYIKKPFSIMELITRVKALLRRTETTEEKLLQLGELMIDNERHAVYVDDDQVELTYKEYELLRLLMTNPGVVMTREVIMRHVWDTEFEGESRTVDMHIKTLRHKLGDAGARIKTVRNVGYVIE